MSDTTYNTKNYAAHGGAEWVIGGKLTILEGAEVRTPPKLRSQTGEIEHGFRRD